MPNSNNKPQHQHNPLPSLADSSQAATEAVAKSATPTGTEPLASGSVEAGAPIPITDFGLVDLEITEQRFWELPQTARELLSLYCPCPHRVGDVLQFTQIPNYSIVELLRS